MTNNDNTTANLCPCGIIPKTAGPCGNCGATARLTRAAWVAARIAERATASHTYGGICPACGESHSQD